MKNKLIKTAMLASTMMVGFTANSGEIRGEYGFKCDLGYTEYVGTTDFLEVIELERQKCLWQGGIFVTTR